MEWKPLSLNDKAVIDQALKKNPLTLSDYTFTNFWIWNGARQYQYVHIDDFLCIKYFDNGTTIYLYPIGEGSRREVISKIIAKEPSFHMRAVPEFALEEIQDLAVKIEAEKARFDYIYSYNDLLNLQGEHFQAKRNFIHQFERNFSFEYQEITPSLIPKILEMEITWLNEHIDPPLGLVVEHKGILNALKDFEALQVYGGAVIVEGTVAAYSLAEHLSKDMIVVHLEKCLKEYKGGYAVINQQILSHMQPVEFVNREEDLGLDNLTKVKQSYHPLRLEKKFALINAK